MIAFNISNMSASIIYESLKISEILKSQISNAPTKADILYLRCTKEELVNIHQEVNKSLKRNENLSENIRKMVVEEIEEIIKEKNITRE